MPPFLCWLLSPLWLLTQPLPNQGIFNSFLVYLFGVGLKTLNNFSIKKPSHVTVLNLYINLSYRAINQKLCFSHTTKWQNNMGFIQHYWAYVFLGTFQAHFWLRYFWDTISQWEFHKLPCSFHSQASTILAGILGMQKLVEFLLFGCKRIIKRLGKLGCVCRKERW